MTTKLLVQKDALSNVSEEDLSRIKKQLVEFKVAPPDIEIEPDPNDPFSSNTVVFGFPGNLLESIGDAVGLSKCDLAGQLAYTACMGASGANAIICAGIGAAVKDACEG
ncbi:hypothetical protein SAMN05216593_103449 [Pseudomonas asturiensis]|uniref:Uncharacterized protein n=1 Tax=Pseudomonas asturiensis TaxID=1190415 RepID=A0A1M7LYS5_9PSED|nr:hypothetical protein [Pseudomonas asturiensis]SHM83350.1 hypothetical protein SAMN05216593_103449 [Pseudomonas asturiensis]